MKDPVDKDLFYESFAKEWDRRVDRDELGKRLRLIFGPLLTPEQVRGKRALDAGCGTGNFSRVLAEWGARLVCLDVGPDLLGEVRKKCQAETVCGDLLKLPFEDGSFDLVLCTEAIEHTTDPRRAVAELCRVVAAGGALIVTTPNKLWIPAVWTANLLCLRPYLGHENWVYPWALKRWIASSGFDIERQFGFNLLPHTFFCRPRFDFLDRLSPLGPFMINTCVKATKPAS